MTGPSTWRILRAFAWLRWRILINSLERRGSRDVIERFSVAFEQLAPAMVAIMMLPSAAALAAIAGYAGWTLGEGQPATAFSIVRVVLIAACGLTIAGPILLSAAERTNAVRLLLLPIPRSVLYLTQSMSALADPWLVLAGVVVVALPAGIAAAGNTGVALLAAGAGLLLLAALIGLTQLMTSAVYLITRDRRRAELFGLIIVVFLPIAAMLPGLLAQGNDRPPPSATERARSVERQRWWSNIGGTALAAVPSEMYVKAVRSAAERTPGVAAVATLGGLTLALHAVAMVAFGRFLSSPGTAGATRSTTSESASRWHVPATSRVVSAVAVNQLRLVLRTPRGRATLLSPLVVFGLFGAMMAGSRDGLDIGPWQVKNGLGLAAFGGFVSLMSILPLAMNQFAVDRAGLTMALLAPLEIGALLRGKAIGNGLVVAAQITVGVAGSAALFPSGDPRLWLCIPLTLFSAYLIVAPVAAMLSAVFPRPVDLNSIGRNSNAHGAAGLLGMLAFLAASLPGLLISLIVGASSGRPGLAAVLLLVWTAICQGISLVLFRAAAALFERRRENLMMTAARPV